MGFWEGDDEIVAGIGVSKLLKGTDYYRNALIKSVVAKVKSNAEPKTYMANIAGYGNTSFLAFKNRGNNAYITHNLNEYGTDTSGYNLKSTCRLLGTFNSNELKQQTANLLGINIEAISLFTIKELTYNDTITYSDYVGEYYVKSQYPDYSYITNTFTKDGVEYIYKYSYTTTSNTAIPGSCEWVKNPNTDEMERICEYYKVFWIAVAKTSTPNTIETYMIPQNSYNDCVLVTYTIDNVSDSLLLSSLNNQSYSSISIESYPIVPIRMMFFNLNQYNVNSVDAETESGTQTRPYYVTKDRLDESTWTLKALGLDIDNLFDSLNQNEMSKCRSAKIMLGVSIYRNILTDSSYAGVGISFDKDMYDAFQYLTDEELGPYKYIDASDLIKGMFRFSDLNLPIPSDIREDESHSAYVVRYLRDKLKDNVYYKAVSKYLFEYFSKLITDYNITTGTYVEHPDDYHGITIQFTEPYSNHITSVSIKNIIIEREEKPDSSIKDNIYSYEHGTRTFTFERPETDGERDWIATISVELGQILLKRITSTDIVTIYLEGFESDSNDSPDATQWQADASIHYWLPLIPSTVGELSHQEQVALFRESVYIVSTSQEFEEGDFWGGVFFEILKVVVTVVLICVAPYIGPGVSMTTAAGTATITSITTAYLSTMLVYAAFTAIATQVISAAVSSGDGILAGILSVAIAAFSLWSGGFSFSKIEFLDIIKLVEIPINAINTFIKGATVELQQEAIDRNKELDRNYNILREQIEDDFINSPIDTEFLSYVTRSNDLLIPYIPSISEYFNNSTRTPDTNKLYDMSSFMNTFDRRLTESRIG